MTEPEDPHLRQRATEDSLGSFLNSLGNLLQTATFAPIEMEMENCTDNGLRNAVEPLLTAPGFPNDVRTSSLKLVFSANRPERFRRHIPTENPWSNEGSSYDLFFSISSSRQILGRGTRS